MVAKRERGDARGGRGRRRRDRLRPGRRPARPRPRVREGAGRLQLLVQLLRDPVRARRIAQPPRRRGARRDPPPRRAGPPRGRAHRGQPRLLPRPRGRLRPPAADPRGRRDAGARAAAALLDRGQPPDRAAARRAARDADGVPPPARPAPVRRRRRPARDGAPLRRGDLPRRVGRAERFQPDDRRDRRLPRRGRARVRATRCASSRRPARPRCTCSRTRRGRAPSPRAPTPSRST